MAERHLLDPTPIHTLRRHARLWRRFVLQALVRETHYRANFIAMITVGILQLIFSLIPVLLLFSFTDEINGWSQGEVIALGGVYQIAVALLWFGIETNMERISTYIRQGDLDLILIRPISPLFYVMLRWVKPAEIFMILSGIAVTIIGLSRSGATTDLSGIVQAVLLLGSGVILVSCGWTAIVLTSFWFTTTGPVSMLVSDLLQVGRYPLSFYPSAIRFLFAFVFPVGFASTFPIDALVGRGSWTIVLIGAVLSIAALVLLRLWWRFGVRFYSSASS